MGVQIFLFNTEVKQMEGMVAACTLMNFQRTHTAKENNTETRPLRAFGKYVTARQQSSTPASDLLNLCLLGALHQRKYDEAKNYSEMLQSSGVRVNKSVESILNAELIETIKERKPQSTQKLQTILLATGGKLTEEVYREMNSTLIHAVECGQYDKAKKWQSIFLDSGGKLAEDARMRLNREIDRNINLGRYDTASWLLRMYENLT